MSVDPGNRAAIIDDLRDKYEDQLTEFIAMISLVGKSMNLPPDLALLAFGILASGFMKVRMRDKGHTEDQARGNIMRWFESGLDSEAFDGVSTKLH